MAISYQETQVFLNEKGRNYKTKKKLSNCLIYLQEYFLKLNRTGQCLFFTIKQTYLFYTLLSTLHNKILCNSENRNTKGRSVSMLITAEEYNAQVHPSLTSCKSLSKRATESNLQSFSTKILLCQLSRHAKL